MKEGPVETVNCPWCSFKFEIVPASSATAFLCPSCGKKSSIGSLRETNRPLNALKISKEAALGVGDHLIGFTVAYRYLNKNRIEQWGSGVLVKIQNRLLLATVAHTRPRSLPDIFLVKKKTTASYSPFEPYACVVGRQADFRKDIAVFELLSDAATVVGAEPIGCDKICDAGTGHQFKSFLVGFPSSLSVPNFPFRGAFGVNGLAYPCEPIEPSRWEAITKQTETFDSNIHVVTEYDNDVVELRSPPFAQLSGLPQPQGMSGGGFWQRPRRIADDEIWTAQSFSLFAIQSAILDKKPFLKGVQIIHWLKLVAETFAELSDELCDRFPRLTNL